MSLLKHKWFSTTVSFFLLFSFVFSALPLNAQTVEELAGANLIQNGTFEAGTTAPTNWSSTYWGTPAPTFKYPDTGRNADKAATVTLSANSNGGAYWAHDLVSVNAGETLNFSLWYKSDVATEVDTEYTNTAGKLSYGFVAALPSSLGAWKQVTATIKVPSGITKMRAYPFINKKGSLTIDDVSLTRQGTTTPPVPPPATSTPPTLNFSVSPNIITKGESATLNWNSTNATSCTASSGWTGSKGLSGTQSVNPTATTTYSLTCNGDGGSISKEVILNVLQPVVVPPPTSSKGMVTFSFDDSWISQYTAALPSLEAAGFKGTFYITTQPLQEAWEDFMTPNQVKAIANKGHEIADHTITHPHLPQLTQAKIKKEIGNSKTYLENLTGQTVVSIAYPYGEANNTVKNLVKAAGYTNGRGVDYDTLNGKATTDKYNLQSQCIEKSTPFSEIKSYIDGAKSKNQWYILCIHEIKTGGDEYSITPAQFQQIVDYVKSIGVKVVTVKEGFSLMSGLN